ncbi:MAG: hypothetical protein JOY60_16155 [Burkholderiaceae bacterium]|nr:hypothetical protein [Roseateles sp.]MBV8471386.1 hypothetical protein [Burkholderiaceae bacterium]
MNESIGMCASIGMLAPRSALKDYVISGCKEVVRENPVVLALQRKSYDRAQYKLYAAQRAYVATNFIRLLKKGQGLAFEFGDVELAGVLQSNLNDEQGIGPDGQYDHALSHLNWKIDYLRALGLEADVPEFPLLPGTQRHVEAFLALEREGTLFSISGALLSLENIIPLEYRAASWSRDHLFPEIFNLGEADTPQVQQEKIRARKYMDDHIIHDAKYHFPLLLRALEKYEGNADLMREIHCGIDLVNHYRKQFYADLHVAMQLAASDMHFYTFGGAMPPQLAASGMGGGIGPFV